MNRKALNGSCPLNLPSIIKARGEEAGYKKFIDDGPPVSPRKAEDAEWAAYFLPKPS